MKIINAQNLIVGRIATKVAKMALLGEEISIINCEKSYITGTKENVLSKFKRTLSMGNPVKGPFQPKRCDLIVKRIIRGMLPYKQEKGRTALSRIKCYNGTPENLNNDIEITTFDEANINKLSNIKYVELATISKIIGGK